jgi:flavin reductase (DIM6/NTAB) family NADH-FMN oxidoreductase RutF
VELAARGTFAGELQRSRLFRRERALGRPELCFATPRHDKFEEIEFSSGVEGCPMLDESLAIFECRTESTIQGGDHVIFIGRVIRAHYRDGEPLIFAAGRYGTHSPLPEDV